MPIPLTTKPPTPQLPTTLLPKHWLNSPLGQYTLNWEQTQIERFSEEVFGYQAVQIGHSAPFLDKSRIRHKLIVAATLDGNVTPEILAEPEYLPIASQSTDLVILPHVLEFTTNPYQSLREVERILIPGGRVIATLFNPLSLWALSRPINRFIAHHSGHSPLPWSGRFIGISQLREWFALLGLTSEFSICGCYNLPINKSKWLDRFSYLEKFGDRWWGFCGAVFVIRAVKTVAGMHVIQPRWRKKIAARQSPVPSEAKRQNTLRKQNKSPSKK